MLSYTHTALQIADNFLVLFTKKLQNYKMKLVYLPLLAVNNIGFLQHLLFGLAPVYVSVKILYFSPSFRAKEHKTKKVYAKSFKIV